MQKLTMVKVVDEGFHPTGEDVQRWNDLMAQDNRQELNELFNDGKLEYFTVSRESVKKQLMLVKIGEGATTQELEQWRDIFNRINNNPCSTVLYTGTIDISIIDIGNIVAVE